MLKRKRPPLYREIVATRWLALAWAVVLLAVDWQSTLLVFFPLTLLVAPFASNAMSLTDHVPGNPAHPFQLATYFEPRTPWQRLMCRINHHTAATHLTHHLFPQVHWTQLPRLQRRLSPLFRKHHAADVVGLQLAVPGQSAAIGVGAAAGQPPPTSAEAGRRVGSVGGNGLGFGGGRPCGPTRGEA